jgi:type IV pilus assembly protein PilE
MLNSIRGNVGPGRHREGGVSLIELMVVVTLVAILASIAVPSYRRYVMRSQRTDATASLLRLQAAQEKYYLQNNAYAPDVTTLLIPATSDQGLYGISIAPGAGNQSYTATAAPVTGKSQQSDTYCKSFTLTDTGVRAVTGTDSQATCWR